MTSYQRFTFDKENTLHRSAGEYLSSISNYEPNKEMITLKKGTSLFHSSTVDSSLHRIVTNEFKFPLKKEMYFAITRDTATAVLFNSLMNRDEEYINVSTPRIGFVLEFKTREPIRLLNAELKSITPICKNLKTIPIIGLYTVPTHLINTETHRDFFNGMVELCLKDEVKHLELVKIHLLYMNRNDIENPPHTIAINYSKLVTCIGIKYLPTIYKKLCENEQFEFDTREEFFEKYKNLVNFDNYVIDTRLANQIPKESVDSDNYIITDSYIKEWFDEATKKTGGNNKKTGLIYILGRNRRIIKEGRTNYVMYNKNLIKLTEARKLDKNKV
jgi:hypothetical protein